MISVLLVVVLLWSFYIGYSRGLLLQSYYFVSSIVALVVATGSYKKLAAFLYLWVPFANATQGSSTYYFDERYLFDLDQIFYAGLAFFVIYLLVYGLMKLIGIFLHLLEDMTPENPWTYMVSGLLSVVGTLISMQLLLTILATIPLAVIQEKLHSSSLAHAIIEYTPFTSSFLKNLWISNSIG